MPDQGLDELSARVAPEGTDLLYVVADGTDYRATLDDLLAVGVISTEQVQDIVGAMVVAGANVDADYDDGANTLTISATGGGGGGSDNVESATISGMSGFSDDFNRANETPLASPYSQLLSQPQYNLSSNHAVPTASEAFALFNGGAVDCTLAVTFTVTGSGHSLVLSWDSGTQDWLLFQCNGGNFQFTHMNAGSVVSTFASGSGAPTSGTILLEIVASGTNYELKSNGTSLWTGSYVTYARTSTVHGFASSITSNTVELAEVSGGGGGTTSVDLDASVASYWDVSIETDGDLTLSGATGGFAADLTVVTRQDGTGSHTLTLPAATWPGGVEATPSTGANDVDVYRFLSVDGGTSWQATQVAAGLS